MKIVFTSLKEFEKDFYRERLSDHEVSLYTEPINRVSAEELERADILSVFVTDRLGKELLSRLPKLKLLITRSVGTDHIDVDFCRERGIRVANVPAYSPRSIAEHAIALMLSLTRKLKRVERNIHNFNFSHEKDILSQSLYTKTVGVIGTGRIGREVAKISLVLFKEVLAYDIKEDEELRGMGVRYVSLSELLENADIISIHVPYTEQTHHLIDRESLKRMKDGVILVNTARGGVIDTEAVYEAVLSGKIGALGLDVFEDEETLLLKRHREGICSANIMRILELSFRDNVIITPHVAYFTERAVENIMKHTVEIINAFAEKKEVEKFRVV